jgi:hypothetical protein
MERPGADRRLDQEEEAIGLAVSPKMGVRSRGHGPAQAARLPL